MTKDQDYDLAQYERTDDPDIAERASAWRAAIGLQQVDRLVPSDCLVSAAHRHIAGEISLQDVRCLVEGYYERRAVRIDASGTHEADLVAVGITEVLGDRSFTFSPAGLCGIHRRLFAKIFRHAGTWRPYDFTKKEWILDGESVLYSTFTDIQAALDHDFAREREFSYKGRTMVEAARHVERFIADIWQVHPFCEGNTRTTAVFAVRYLRKLGFDVDNDAFLKDSWFFRNALVRANYSSLKLGLAETMEPLDRFFDNLLFGARHRLRSRELHIRWKPAEDDGSDNGEPDKGIGAIFHKGT